MPQAFIEKPALTPEAVAALRKAVGWDERADKIKQYLGRLYFWAGCLDGDLLVGYVEVISDGIDDGYIRNLIVHPSYRRRGIGRKLVQMAAARIEADGIKTANVLFEPELTPFYRKAGFTIVAGGLIDNEMHKQRE